VKGFLGRFSLIVVGLLASGCGLLSYRQPGDPCDPESHDNYKVPVADDAACPDRGTAGRIVASYEDSVHVLSVDSDGTRVRVPAAIECCYDLRGSCSGPRCLIQVDADGGALSCPDAAAVRGQVIDSYEVDACAVSGGPTTTDYPAHDECSYEVTTYTQDSCSSNLPLNVATTPR
jgi:hypothetical protein